MLINVKNINNKNIIPGGNFNMHFDSKLETKGGKPVLKKQSIAKMVELLENFDLCDIWRIRNFKKRRFTFRQNHFSGYIQRRLDYFFVSNSLQEAIKSVDILASFSTDHSPIFITLSKLNEFTKGKGLWKFNNSLISNVKKMKNHISDILNFPNNENIKDDQVIWEYLKYEIRKFTIRCSKRLAKTLREERECLERKLKILEQNSESNLNNNPEYYECKTQIEDIYQIQVDGIRTRSKCMWYEFGEKSSKFFLNLEKNRAIQGQVRTIVSNEKEITDESEINAHIASFYESLFKEKLSFKNENLIQYLENISMPCLSKENQDSCEGVITEKELFEALKYMQNNKSPGNDGLSKEFYETFWEELKKPFMYATQKSYNIKQLCVSKRQAVIKLVEKKGIDKRFIKNWRPI